MKLQTTLQVDLSRASGDRIPLVLSTDAPIEDGFSDYPTVLEHSSSAVDLSRAPLPLIEGHDSSRVNIGKVEGLQVEGGKLRGFMVLGTTQRARELLEDIKAGIVRSVSIGAKVLENVLDKGVMRVTRWQPVELSLVAVPADPGTGLYRSHSMTDQASTTQSKPSRSERNSEVAKLRRENEILEIGIEYGVGDLAQEAIDDNWPIERFRREAVELHFERREQELERSATSDGRHKPITSLALHRKGEPVGERYDFGRAMEISANKFQGNCLEREIHDDLLRGQSARNGGLLVPLELLQVKRVVTVGGGAAGASLVGTEHMPDAFVDLLRPKTKITSRATTLTGLKGDVSIPRQATAATATTIRADGTATTTASDSTYDNIFMTPWTYAGYTVYSRRVSIQSLPMIQDLIMRDLALQIANKLEADILAGDGSTEPEGIYTNSDVDEEAITTPGQPTRADILNMEAALAAANALDGDLAFICTPAVMSFMKGVDLGTDTGKYLWESSGPGVGVVNGYPAMTSSLLPTHAAILGNWTDVLLGIWTAGELLVDPYTGQATGNVGVRLFVDADVALRHPESYSRLAPS